MEGTTSTSGRQPRRPPGRSGSGEGRRGSGGWSPDGRSVRALEEEIEWTKKNCAKVKRATAHRGRLNAELEQRRDALVRQQQDLVRACMEKEAGLKAALADVEAVADSGCREVCALEDEYVRLGVDGQRAIDELQAKLAEEAREVEALETEVKAKIEAKCPPSMRRELKYHQDVVTALRQLVEAEDTELQQLEGRCNDVEAEEAALDAEQEELWAMYGRTPGREGEGWRQLGSEYSGDASCDGGHVGDCDAEGKENAASPNSQAALTTTAGGNPFSLHTPRPSVGLTPRNLAKGPPSTCCSTRHASCCSVSTDQERSAFKALPVPKLYRPFIPKRSDKPLTQPELPKPIFWTDYRSFYRETEFHPWLKGVKEAKAMAEWQKVMEARVAEEEQFQREMQKVKFKARPMPDFGVGPDTHRKGGSTSRSSGSREGRNETCR